MKLKKMDETCLHLNEGYSLSIIIIPYHHMHSLLFLLYEKGNFKSPLNLAEYRVLVKAALWPHLQKHGHFPLALKFQEGHFKWLCVGMFQRQSIGIDPSIHRQVFFSYQSYRKQRIQVRQ